MKSRSTRPRRPLGLSLLAATAMLASSLVAFVGATPAGATDITSAGPLTLVSTTPDLNCAVNHAGDTSGEFYGDTACGTFVTDGSTVWGPDYVPAGPEDGDTGYAAWTPVSQTPVTGAGTSSDPFKIVTVVSGGPFTVTQTDTYIVGNESYQTDVRVQSSSAVNATIYRAGDCYLQDSDDGLGRIDGAGITCLADPSSANPDRVESWYPLTGGSRFIEGDYGEVWDAVMSMAPFPNAAYVGATPGEPHDNGAGLSWTQAIGAGGVVSVSHITTFSPVGALPLTVTKTVDNPTAAPGAEIHYTITVTNPNGNALAIDDIVDTMPAGFGYVLGSTRGVTTADPNPVCNPLRWAGPFTVPGASGTGDTRTPGTVSITFTGVAGTTPGSFTNSANAHAPAGVTVIPANDVAPVEVSAGGTTTTSTSTTTSSTTTSSTTSTTVSQSSTSSTSSTSTTVAPSSTTSTTVAVAPAGGLPACGTTTPPPGQAPVARPVTATPRFTG